MQNYQNDQLVKLNSLTNNHSFEIHSIQWLSQDDEYKNDIAQSNNHFQIIWITKGDGNIWIDLQKWNFQGNKLFFVKPQQVFRFQSVNSLEGYVISFTDSFLGTDLQEPGATYHGSLFKILANANGIQVSSELVSEVNDFAGRMIKEYNSVHLFRDEMLRRYFKIFLILLSRELNDVLQITSQTRNIELFQRFMSLLDKHYKTEKMVCGYARMLLVTPNYLNEIVKKTTGFSAGYHIRQRIVLEAKRQATYSDSCMKQIGYYLGFNDMAHFSKFFKTATGMNFTEFKKEKMIVSLAS